MQRVRHESAEAPAEAVRDFTFVQCVFICAMKYHRRKTPGSGKEHGKNESLKNIFTIRCFRDGINPHCMRDNEVLRNMEG